MTRPWLPDRDITAAHRSTLQLLHTHAALVPRAVQQLRRDLPGPRARSYDGANVSGTRSSGDLMSLSDDPAWADRTRIDELVRTIHAASLDLDKLIRRNQPATQTSQHDAARMAVAQRALAARNQRSSCQGCGATFGADLTHHGRGLCRRCYDQTRTPN